jgi:hypothetical protein
VVWTDFWVEGLTTIPLKGGQRVTLTLATDCADADEFLPPCEGGIQGGQFRPDVSGARRTGTPLYPPAKMFTPPSPPLGKGEGSVPPFVRGERLKFFVKGERSKTKAFRIPPP